MPLPGTVNRIRDAPRFLAVAIPAALMEAMALLEELDVTWFEMSCILPSE
jgi:hypothetical protein